MGNDYSAAAIFSKKVKPAGFPNDVGGNFVAVGKKSWARTWKSEAKRFFKEYNDGQPSRWAVMMASLRG